MGKRGPLAGAILAAPYLLARAAHRRLAERRQPAQGSVPIAAANRQGLTAPRPTMARSSR